MQRSRGSSPAYGVDAVAARDPVVDDLELVLVEALHLREVAGEALRDRDVHVRERGDRAVGEAEEAALAEPVEAVLGREPDGDARRRARDLAVDVGVHEVRVQDPRPAAREERGHVRVRDRVDVRAQAHFLERHAAALELARELPCARLVLVEHQELDVPPALAEIGEELEQVRLRAGDARDLLDVEDEPVAAHLPRPRRGEDPARPGLDGVALLDAFAQAPSERCRSSASSAARVRIRSTRLCTSSRAKRCSGSSSESKTGFDASTGTQLAAAS